MAANPVEELREHGMSERLGCCPIFVEAILNQEVTHSGWCDQRGCQVRLQELTCVSVCPQQCLTACGRAEQMSADLQWEAERVNDASVSASSWHILDHVRDWLVSQIMN